MPKRKSASGESKPVKRARVHSRERTSQPAEQCSPTAAPPLSGAPTSQKRKRKAKASTQNATAASPNTFKRGEIIHKLAPPRPFPTVPSSVSASGPKSAHKEGKNFLCISRHTPLSHYLSRCKKLFVEDEYDTVYLHALGAAIPHLLTLSVSLPPLLPFARDKIKLEVRTGTIELIDEIIPEDEDEDMSLRARDKGSVTVVIRVLEGLPGDQNIQTPTKSGNQREIVVQEHDQDDEMDQETGVGEADHSAYP